MLRVGVLVGSLVALAMPLPAAAATPGHLADGRLDDWVGAATMLSGRSTVDRGELVYDDYLYDDYGPNLDRLPNLPAFVSVLTSTNGDYRYPDAEKYGHNAADLRQLRVAVDGGALHVAVFFQTLRALDTSIATVAIDTDGDGATGASAWPDGSGINTRGVDRFITVWGRGARVSDAAGGRTPVRAAPNLEENAYEADVPLDLLGPLSPAARVYVVTGLADGDRYRAQRPGRTAVFDLGFQGREEYGKVSAPTGADPNVRFLDAWSDRRQAAALATGDLTGFAQPLRPDVLAAGGGVAFQLEPGFYNRIFRSRYDYGEGVDTGVPTGRSPMFRSRYQPYGLFIPSGYRAGVAARLLITGHSAFGNMNQYPAVSPNWLTQLGEQRAAVIVFPLARSTLGTYRDLEVADVLEAWQDAATQYTVDPDRTDIAGIAAGGLLTYRLGLLMPDAFARAAVHLGPPEPPVFPLVGNALNLPFELNYSTSAPLVPIAAARAMEWRFRGAGNAYRFYDNPTAVEPFNLLYQDEWAHTRDWLGTGGRRETNPVRVRYVRDPAKDLAGHGIRFDHAYWVAGLEPRDASAGAIDATTYALGGGLSAIRIEPPRLLPTLEVVNGQRQVPGPPIAVRNAFSAKLTNLGAARFVTDRMGLDPDRPVTATLAGDGVTALRFDGTWPPATVATVDGVRVPVSVDGQGITCTVHLDGTHTLHIGQE